VFTESLCDAVQHNCNIVDARHAGNFTLCIYLMKMREYCRWDKGYSFNDMLTKEEVGEWVTQRESLWDELDEQPFESLKINGECYDPFDTDLINQALKPQGLVYSGGIGARSVPHFFLGKLDMTKTIDDYEVVIASEECARDLSSPPAMTLQNKIFLRKESIRRMLWEKLQEWQWHKIENAASRAFSYYDFKKNVDKALDEMTETEMYSILLHEKGEIDTSNTLGSKWKDFLSGITSTRLDLMLRAAKDFYADTLVMLPTLIAEDKQASIHFYAANMSPLRKKMCPSFLVAYKHWCETNDMDYLDNWIKLSQAHWGKICSDALVMYLSNKTELHIEQFIENSSLGKNE